MIDMFRDEEILEFLELLKDSDMITILEYDDKLDYFVKFAEIFKNKIQNEIIKRALILLQETSKKDVINRKIYRDIRNLLND